MKRTNILVSLGVLLVGSLVGLIPAGSAQAIPGVQARGGSNYGWYNLTSCNREPYGVINNFGDAAGTIKQQLRNMRNSGQDRLRIPIYHHNGQDTGTVMNSAGGDLTIGNRYNLSELLKAVKAAGFAEVMISMHPQGSNDPTTWSSFNQARYNENLQLINNLRPIIAGAGIPYKIDLLNEGIPTTGQTQVLQYTRDMWDDYTQQHGKADTVGFSVIGQEPARVARVSDVYQGNAPNMLSIHFYGTSSQNEYAQFVSADNSLQQQGLGAKPWIIGESYYNDQAAATNFANAIRDTDQEVKYQLQWPLQRSATCSDVSVAPPSNYRAYSDLDGDGQSDEAENRDGNGDGITDNRQASVATRINPVTGKYVTLQTTGDCDAVNGFSVTRESTNAAQDKKHRYPVGMNNFNLGCDTSGGSASVKVFYDKKYNTADWKFRKFNNTNNTYKALSSFTGFGTTTVGSRQVTTASFTMKDGGANDDDGAANNEIIDPSGPALAVVTAGSGGNQGAAGDGELADTGETLVLPAVLATSLLLVSAYVLLRKRRFTANNLK